MDQDNIKEAKKLIKEQIIPQIDVLIKLLPDINSEDYKGKYSIVSNQIKVLKEYLRPSKQSTKNSHDQDIFTMADTLNGLLKKSSTESLKSLKDVANGIRKKLNIIE